MTTKEEESQRIRTAPPDVEITQNEGICHWQSAIYFGMKDL